MALTTASREARSRPEFLRALRVVPDAGLGELELYFRESFTPLIDVKDTP
jgi:hypothetical protein